MITKALLQEIIEHQRANLSQREMGLKREALNALPDLQSHTLILTGIRRCGKSTLLYQLLHEKYPQGLYLDFEDPRLYDFEPNDFTRLDQVIADADSSVLLFDEIQSVDGWESYVRKKLDEGLKLVVTGSNASLLNKELGTKLTGRHISKELFPFSWNEYSAFKDLDQSEAGLLQYMQTGGFPEYVKHGYDDILHQLFEDILIRDIAVRNGVRDIKSLQRLALYLVSNVGNRVTGNSLKTPFGIKSTSTVMEYLSYLEESYLFQFIPKFSYSVKKQSINPRKVYAVDTGLVNVNSKSFTEDRGSIFENLVYLHLRRQTREIYYFTENGECDFVVFEKGEITGVLQVCYELTQDNLDRELNGLFEALDFFDLETGSIVTLNQSDQFKKESKTANIIPCHEFMA